MKEITEALLEQYYDGELDAQKAREVEAELKKRPELRASLARLNKMGDLLNLMNTEDLADVSFSGFSERVTAEIARGSGASTGLWERMSVWAREFFRHRPQVWVPAAAAVGVAAAVLIGLTITSRDAAMAPSIPGNDGIYWASNAASPAPRAVSSSRIDAVEFGESTGMIYEVATDNGGTVGVVWVIENQLE